MSVVTRNKPINFRRARKQEDCCLLCESVDSDELGWVCRLCSGFSIGPLPTEWICDSFKRSRIKFQTFYRKVFFEIG